jgi:hypothetical protein
MKYLVWAEHRIGARTIVAKSPKDAVRQWADLQRAATWEDESVDVLVADDTGHESTWTVETSFDYTIKERT